MIVTIKCPKCGESIDMKTERGFVFCNNCGEKIIFGSQDATIGNEENAESQNNVINEGNPVTVLNAVADEIPQKQAEEPVKKKSTKGIVIAIILPISLTFVILAFFYFISPKTVTWFCFHQYDEPTCTKGETCKRCGLVKGDPLGHRWIDATCTAPKTCDRCWITEGNALGHSWRPATCTKPKTCDRCGETEGKALGHNYMNATCTTPKKCSRCGDKQGNALGHNVKDYICTRCNETIVKMQDVPNILDISTIRYTIDYFGGITLSMSFKNKLSSKTISYITMKVQFYNANGDVIEDNLGFYDYATLKYTGPLKPNSNSGTKDFRAVYYNSTFSGTLGIKEIVIDYSDGTKLVLDSTLADEAVVDWRD